MKIFSRIFLTKRVINDRLFIFEWWGQIGTKLVHDRGVSLRSKEEE